MTPGLKDWFPQMFTFHKILLVIPIATGLLFPANARPDEAAGNANRSGGREVVISAKDLAPVFSSPAAIKAAGLVDAGQYDQARNVLLANSAEVAADHPDESRFLLAWVCYMTGDWLCTESVTDGMKDGVPQFADYVTLMRASALSGLKNDRAALSMLESIPPASPVRRELMKLKAEVLVDLGRDFEAAPIIKTLVEDREADPDMIADLTDVLMSSAKRDKALAELKDLYFRSSSSGRGGLRGLLKKLGVATEPSQDEYMDRAWTLLNAHANADALKLVDPLTRSTDRARRCEALEIAARANAKLRQHPEAVARFRAIVTECGALRDMPAMFYLGIRSAWKGGDQKQGDEWARQLARDYPDASYNDDIAVLRARTAIEQGRHDDAVAILDEAIRRWPNGDMAGEARWLVAWSFVSSGKNAEALRRLTDGCEATAADPVWGPRFQYWKARILQRSGRQKDATKAYRECAANWPMSFHALMSLNRLAESSKKQPAEVLQDIIDDPVFRTFRSTPRFLSLGQIPEDHPASRAIWLCRAGLATLASRELRQSDPSDAAAGWLKSMLSDRAGNFTVSHRTAKDLLAGRAFWPDAKTAGYYRLAYPRPFQGEVRAAARESHIDPLLVYAVMREESAFISGVESWANATGLMQLIMPTARSVGRQLKIDVTKDRLSDPAVNTRLGARYLRNLLERFKNPVVAIPGYNAGGTAVSRWLGAMGDVQVDEFVESIPASEAREYARKVFESYAAYSFLYGDQPYRPMKMDFRTSGR